MYPSSNSLIGVLYLNNIILLSQPDALYLNDDTKMKTFIEIFNNIFINNEAMCKGTPHGTLCDVGKSWVEIL